MLDGLEFKQDYCTKMLWRYLTWIIIDDSRQYFSKILGLEDFAGKRMDEIEWPTSLLGLTCQELARLRPLRPGDFPHQWDETEHGRGERTLEYINFGRQYQDTNNWQQNYSNQQRQQQQQGQQQNGNGSNGKDREGWALGRHPKIADLMARYRRKFNYINLSEILTAAGKRLTDLPCPERFRRNGKCDLCYVDYLGKCGIMGCHFVHARPSDLGDQFATDMCTVIEPGINKMLQDNYVNSRKRQRRSN